MFPEVGAEFAGQLQKQFSICRLPRGLVRNETLDGPASYHTLGDDHVTLQWVCPLIQKTRIWHAQSLATDQCMCRLRLHVVKQGGNQPISKLALVGGREDRATLCYSCLLTEPILKF